MGAYAPNHALDEVDRFYLDAALIIHSNYQTKNRMVECKVCRMVLPRSEPTLLLQHAKHHGTEKKYAEVNKLQALNIHRADLANKIKKTDGNTLAVCAPCTKVFQDPTDLYLHLETVDHSHELVQYCCLCQRRDIYNLQFHFQAYHGASFKCPIKTECLINVYRTSFLAHLLEHRQLLNKYSTTQEDVYNELIKVPAINTDTGVVILGELRKFPQDQDMRTIIDLMKSEEKYIHTLEHSYAEYTLLVEALLERLSVTDSEKRALSANVTKVIVRQHEKMSPIKWQTYFDVNMLFGDVTHNKYKWTPANPFNKHLAPIIIIGSTMLRDIIILDNGKTSSVNLSDETQRLFGSSIAQSIPTLETNCIKGFNLDYFKNVQAKLTGMKDFRGLLILETDIQSIITTTTSVFS